MRATQYKEQYMSIIYADISAYQGTINWQQYRSWSDTIAMKATEGTGFTDPRYHQNRAGAEGVGLRVIHYHYARPDLNTPQSEAEWFFNVVGNVGAGLLMLDYEQQTIKATAEWAYEWLARAEELFGQAPTIYASTSFVFEHLQDARLTRYPLVLANWTFNPDARPQCPHPWTSYIAVQYTDKQTNVPGITGPVDANIFLGGSTMAGVPQDWTDDGHTLTSPNGNHVVLGFREWILTHTWNPDNQPLGAEFYPPQVQLHNTSLGSGSVQLFRDNLLWYTSAHGVIEEPYLGLEIQACYSEIASLQQQLAQATHPPVDISAVEADIHAIGDAVANALGESTAKTLSDLAKLKG